MVNPNAKPRGPFQVELANSFALKSVIFIDKSHPWTNMQDKSILLDTQTLDPAPHNLTLPKLPHNR
jgi:hypothetical protein